MDYQFGYSKNCSQYQSSVFRFSRLTYLRKSALSSSLIGFSSISTGFVLPMDSLCNSPIISLNLIKLSDTTYGSQMPSPCAAEYTINSLALESINTGSPN